MLATQQSPGLKRSSLRSSLALLIDCGTGGGGGGGQVAFRRPSERTLQTADGWFWSKEKRETKSLRQEGEEGNCHTRESILREKNPLCLHDDRRKGDVRMGTNATYLAPKHHPEWRGRPHAGRRCRVAPNFRARKDGWIGESGYVLHIPERKSRLIWKRGAVTHSILISRMRYGCRAIRFTNV